MNIPSKLKCNFHPNAVVRSYRVSAPLVALYMSKVEAGFALIKYYCGALVPLEESSMRNQWIASLNEPCYYIEIFPIKILVPLILLGNVFLH